MTDPRKAKTLDEAALNPDGKTYNGARALSWLSRVIGGVGMTEAEVMRMWEEAKAKKAAKEKQP